MGKSKNHMVHRLVAEAFIANPNKKLEVNHKNGNKQDNRTSNLEWSTSSENQIHAYDTGLKESNAKYIVECVELNLKTIGCSKMEDELRKLGFHRANAGSIYASSLYGGTHLDLRFKLTRILENTAKVLFPRSN